MNKLLADFWKQLQNIKPFSWQSLVMLGVLAWILSFLTETNFIQEGLARLGWIFLTAGVGWGLSGVKWNIWGFQFYPGPWITGALISVLLFQGFVNDVRSAFVSWPIISASVASVAKFIKSGRDLIDPRVPDPSKYAADRQELVNLFLFSFLLSCWFQFHFLLQEWLIDYPSLLSDRFDRSAFVVRLDSNTNDSRGIQILNVTEAVLRETLQSRTWAEIERWLDDANQQIAALRPEVFARLPSLDEDSFWNLQAAVLPRQPTYTLELRAVWDGPASNQQGYYARKICYITQSAAPSISPTGQVTPAPPNPIECETVEDRLPAPPRPQ